MRKKLSENERLHMQQERYEKAKAPLYENRIKKSHKYRENHGKRVVYSLNFFYL